jgi:pimeloyl-ACP methyl ester carboxylesterase
MSSPPEVLAGAVTVGAGPHKVIALHGWFGTADGWGPLPRVLDGERFTYVFLNHRGYGARLETPGEHTMTEMAADALAAADALGFERFSVMGHSMSGKAALRLLALAPNRVRRVVGLTPVPANAVPFDEAGWGFFTSAAQEPAARRGILDLTTGNRLTGVWLDQMLAHSLATTTPKTFGDSLLAWAKEDFADLITGQPTPTLVVVGEHDKAIDAATIEATWLAQLPNARMAIVPNAGHYPMFETPVHLATIVEAFLAED